MPEPIPSRNFVPSDPPDDELVELSVGDMTTHLGDTDPDRTGPHVPGAASPADLPVLPGYAIERELGRGGIGVVYLARHVKLNRPAALKMVLGSARAESKEIIRFLAEAEAVAAVRHPHVVGVYEFGEADGRPYLALEYCPGGSLAEQLESGGRKLPIAAAVLVRKLADGLAAAHALGIVHRDLKPANVLFDEAGEPKVTDFGLAKRGTSAGVTQAGAVMGTPAYMSPEQAKGESNFVGPQADVWALGVILYECLTGKRPFIADDDWALLNKIMTTDPAGVRTVSRAVPVDLELICRKCLAKSPHERYATASGLFYDLGRFLDGKPITARPAGPMERGWKWAKRNKPAVAVILALASGAVASTWQAVRATAAEGATANQLVLTKAAEETAREREQQATAAKAEAEKQATEAKRQERTATEVKTFFQQVLAQSEAEAQVALGTVANPNLTVKEAMDRAAKLLDGRFEGQPLVEAEVRFTIGLAYQRLGALIPAETHLRRSVELRRTILGPEHQATICSQLGLGAVLSDRRKYLSAAEVLEDALRVAERSLGPNDESTLCARSELEALHVIWGKNPIRTEQMLLETLAVKKKVLGAKHPSVLVQSINLAVFCMGVGRYDRAEPILVESLAAKREIYGDKHPSTLFTLSKLSRLYQATRRFERAEPLLVEVVAGQQEVLGELHPNTIESLTLLADLYAAHGRLADVEPLLVRALAGLRRTQGNNHLSTLAAVDTLADVYRLLGRHGEAEALYRELLQSLESSGHLNAGTALTRSCLGMVLLGQRKYPEAEVALLAGYRGMKESVGDPRVSFDRNFREIAEHLARLYEATNKQAEAAKWRAEAAKHKEVAPRPRAVR